MGTAFGRSRISGVGIALGVSLSLGAAACGGDDSGASSTTGASATAAAAAGDSSPQTTSDSELPGVTAAREFIAGYAEQPTTFAMQQYPLSAAPPKKQVGFVVCPDPACARFAEFVEEGTDILGWDLTSVNVNDWNDPGSAIQQLIDSDVDYIGLTGFPMAAFQSQMDQMRSKGIKLFSAYGTDVPAGDENGLYANSYDTGAADVYGRVITDYVIADSNGAADVLLVTLGTTPILDAQLAVVEDEYAKNCPACTTTVVSGSQNDLATGGMPQLVVSALQTNTSIDYVQYIYASLETGVVSAMKSAGISEDVKSVGTQALAAQLQGIVDGTTTAWTALPLEFSMWTMVDQMARDAAGEWSLEIERESTVPPMYLVTTAEQAAAIKDLPAGWPGPEGFKDAFKELWGA
jgi:ribose transport system substrate-binding protein